MEVSRGHRGVQGLGGRGVVVVGGGGGGVRDIVKATL